MWEVESDSGESGALKVLHKTSGDRYPRFKREVEILAGLDPDAFQILPVVDSFLPDRPSPAERPWFVMPLATGLAEAVEDAPLRVIVEAVRQIASTLSKLLAQERINHRDIKPANLYSYRGKFVVGDFGLAKRPDDPKLTQEGKVVGPSRYLPSEVFVVGADPDWEKVDVACLGRTCWQLVSGTSWVPLGPIVAGGEYTLTQHSSEPYVGELDEIVTLTTHETPAKRPTLQALAEQLHHWLVGADIRDSVLEEHLRMQANGDAVLRWLVRYVRSKPVFKSLRYDIDNPDEASEISGLTEGEVGEALEDLAGRYLIEADPHHPLGSSGAKVFTRVYPTQWGIEEVESRELLLAQAAPILRELVTRKGLDYLSLPPGPTMVGAVRVDAPEVYFLLTYLESIGYVTFDDRREGAGQPLLLNLKVTPSGREWAATRYSGVEQGS